MPGKRGKQQQQRKEEEDDLEFLMAAAAANQAKVKAAGEAPKGNAEADSWKWPPLPEKVSISFPDRSTLPEVERQEYVGYRPKAAQAAEEERLQYMMTVVPDLREGAEVHRRVRQWAMQNVIKPGVNLYDMCTAIEEGVRRLSGYEPITRGLAFPCGCSLNNCAAHWTPNRDDGRVLQPDDVMKIDFGVNINGNIIDSAFTVCFDDKFEPLLRSAKEATNVGVKMAGIDVRLCDIGEAIQEVFEASSIELNGKHYDIKPISNLSGHLMGPYTIHSGKAIPLTRGGSSERMEEGELYACETFGSTGKGSVTHIAEGCSHFMVSPNPRTPQTPQQRKLLKTLQDNFSTLAFCPRMIDQQVGIKRYALDLQRLGKLGAVVEYPALVDTKGSYVAQFEHSFILLPTHKEILSRGDDY